MVLGMIPKENHRDAALSENSGASALKRHQAEGNPADFPPDEKQSYSHAAFNAVKAEAKAKEEAVAKADADAEAKVIAKVLADAQATKAKTAAALDLATKGDDLEALKAALTKARATGVAAHENIIAATAKCSLLLRIKATKEPEEDEAARVAVAMTEAAIQRGMADAAEAELADAAAVLAPTVEDVFDDSAQSAGAVELHDQKRYESRSPSAVLYEAPPSATLAETVSQSETVARPETAAWPETTAKSKSAQPKPMRTKGVPKPRVVLSGVVPVCMMLAGVLYSMFHGCVADQYTTNNSSLDTACEAIASRDTFFDSVATPSAIFHQQDQTARTVSPEPNGAFTGYPQLRNTFSNIHKVAQWTAKEGTTKPTPEIPGVPTFKPGVFEPIKSIFVKLSRQVHSTLLKAADHDGIANPPITRDPLAASLAIFILCIMIGSLVKGHQGFRTRRSVPAEWMASKSELRYVLVCALVIMSLPGARADRGAADGGVKEARSDGLRWSVECDDGSSYASVSMEDAIELMMSQVTKCTIKRTSSVRMSDAVRNQATLGSATSAAAATTASLQLSAATDSSPLPPARAPPPSELLQAKFKSSEKGSWGAGTRSIVGASVRVHNVMQSEASQLSSTLTAASLQNSMSTDSSPSPLAHAPPSSRLLQATLESVGKDAAPVHSSVRRLATTTVSPGVGTLQAAYDAATAGDVLELAPGTYTGSGNEVLVISKDITIRAQNAGQAILDGENARRVIKITSGNVVLEGLNIAKGYVDGMHESGGGVSISGGTVAMTTCSIYSNTAYGCLYCGQYNSGGGVSISSGTMTMTTCSIYSNGSTSGGGVDISTSGTVTMTACSIYSNTASVISTSKAEGGGVSVNGNGGVTMTSCSIYSNTAKDGGGGLKISGMVTMTSCSIYSNTAATGGGIDMFVGTATLSLTRVYDNTATATNGGANINPQGGSLYYALPAPPGHWLPNSDCVVNRAPCESWNNACLSVGCSVKAGTSTDSPTPWTPTSCKVPIFIQPCDWQTDACAANPPTDDCLLGKKIFFMPYFPVDVTFPYPCAAGYLGSAQSAYQTSSDCAGKCPAGTYQPDSGQTTCKDCPAGHFCPEGSTTALPCPGGTASSATKVGSASACTAVLPGYWAPIGSSAPIKCPSSGFYCPGKLLDEKSGGSLPIQTSVGGSSQTTQVEAVQKEMTLGVSCATFNIDTVKQALATQYNVDVALITLSNPCARRRRQLQSAAGLTLTISIATSGTAADGTPVSAPVADLLTAVQNVNDAVLGSSLGTALGTSITVSSTAPSQATVTRTVAFDCPKGKWCTAGLVVDCPLGTYNPLEKQDFATACILCPLNSITLQTSSTSRSACTCSEGYYDANASSTIDADLLATTTKAGQPVSMMADVVQCLECPVGTSCAVGSTLESMPLLGGYFRLDNSTVDVRICPDARKNCSATFGTASCQSSSGCKGGAGNPCAGNLTGTYCELCDRSDGALVFYKPATDTAVASCEDCGNRLGQTFGVFALGLAVLILFIAAVLRARRRLSAPTTAWLRRINGVYTPVNKAKILFTFYQIATKVPSVYGVSLPTDVNDFLESFSSFISFGMNGVATTPLECLGLTGYVWRLVFWMLLPPIIIGVIISSVCISRSASSRKRRRAGSTAPALKTRLDSDDEHGGAFHLADAQAASETPPTFVEQSLPPVLTALFFLYPLVTKAAFDGFPCYSFANGRGWLRADVSIECGTADHAAAMGVAWIAVVAYPIGIWLFCLICLWHASSAIIAGKETNFTRGVGMLHREYDLTAFWWELAEMVRKFLLVGLFVTIEPGSILQITIGTIVCAAFLLIQLQAKPYKNAADDYLAAASSFALLMLFTCSIIFKYDALTTSDDLQAKMSLEQKEAYLVPNVLLSAILFASVVGSLLFAGVLVALQVVIDVKERKKLRRLKYVSDDKWVVCKQLDDPQAFHLFLSHAWPAAQDRMRIVKARFLEALPSCRTFLDVDDLKSGSGTAEVDKSECILVFCTAQYFTKKNSLKELYRAVVQKRPILAMLEPDATQEGGLNQAAIEALITNVVLDKFKLRKKWAEWKEDGELLPTAFAHAPDEADVRAALFAIPPVEWNRLPHFQDVTVRKTAQDGILGGKGGELYLQGEAAMGKVSLPPPLTGREFHLFCSPHNAGAKEHAEELKDSSVWVTKGKKASAPLTYTADIDKLSACDHMLVVLDERTWTSGEDTANLVEDLHAAMQVGVHILCVHEFPSVVGPPRHECEFSLMFDDDWTPAHLTGGAMNLYKEIALALKGVEWRKPGLVAFASKLVASTGPHTPIEIKVPSSYEPATGPNPWTKGEDQATAQGALGTPAADLALDPVATATVVEAPAPATDLNA